MRKKFQKPEFAKTQFEAVAYLDKQSNAVKCTHPNKRVFHFLGMPYGFICDDCGLRYNVADWDK